MISAEQFNKLPWNFQINFIIILLFKMLRSIRLLWSKRPQPKVNKNASSAPGIQSEEDKTFENSDIEYPHAKESDRDNKK